MTAYRVVDDHTELENIGSNTHGQIDVHIDTTAFVVVSGAAGNIPASARLLTGSGLTITDGGPGGNLLLTVTGGGGSANPAGNDTEVQFNDGGVFGSSSNFVFNKTANALKVNNLSGSLTRLTNGAPYLVAGSNVTISTGSNGSVTISSSAAAASGNFLTSWVESPVGDVDGVNMIYTLSNVPYPSDSLWFYVNGVLQIQGASFDYTTSANEITMNYSPTSGSNLLATYAHVDTTSYGTFTKWIDFVTGSTDGINTVYTLSNPPNPIGSLMLYVNGVLQKRGASDDYTATGNTIAMNYAPSIASALVASYTYTVVQPSTTTSWMEIPSGSADGSNTAFSIANTPNPINSLMFFVNGILQRQGSGADYTISGNNISMSYAPNSGSNILATYPY